jgi:hypothetical protein
MKICMWNVWNLKFWELKCLNCDVWILKIKNWNLYVKQLNFQIFKTKMFEFGCVNTKSWKLKTKIWNLSMKCLIGIWNLKTKMFEYWKLKCLKTKNWNVRILKIEN